MPGSRELVAKSQGVLVFPAVVGASLGVGAEYGRGVLRTAGRTQAYYSTTAGSIGFQAGAQSKAVIYLFTTQESLAKFRNSKGWTAGADATVALATIGANRAAGYQLATDDPVMAIGGFNGTDQWPTLEAFQQMVEDGEIHYFLVGGIGPGGAQGGSQNGSGTSTSSQISAWVQSNFATVTIDGSVFYDLTQPTA